MTVSQAPWYIELSLPNSSEMIRFPLSEQTIIGRSVPGEVNQPDIDLTPFEAEEFGVSRRHIKLFSEDKKLMVVDLGSNNGTKLDGKPLNPYEPYTVKNQSELTLGRLDVRLQWLVVPSTPGETDKLQPEAADGEHILIVEEEPDLAHMLSDMLRNLRYQTTVNGDVISAIRSYNKRRPHVIIIDLALEDMNGLELCRYVRRDVVNNTVPLIVIGDYDRAAGDARQAGADEFYSKPLVADEIIRAVGRLIEQQLNDSGGRESQTKQLIGTAPLQAYAPETRKSSIVLYVSGYSDAPITMIVKDGVSFGRSPGSGTLSEHVNLNAYGAGDQGVSRLHMYMYNREGSFMIEDNKSTNGTFLNGNPLDPGQAYVVGNGDEIRLGALRMYIYFLND